MTGKRKVSVSLDEDLVAELEAADEALSGQVNEAIRAEVERRRRIRLLTGMLDSLDAEYGPVDEALVATASGGPALLLIRSPYAAALENTGHSLRAITLLWRRAQRSALR
jgi:hypothetical protein